MARVTLDAGFSISRQRYHVYFHARIFWQTSRLHRRTRGRFSPKKSRVNLVHSDEVLHISQINCRFNYLLQTASGRIKNRAQIFQHLLRLLRNAPGNELTGGGIDRYLTGRKHKTICNYCLGIRTDSVGSLFGLNDLSQESESAAKVAVNEKRDFSRNA